MSRKSVRVENLEFDFPKFFESDYIDTLVLKMNFKDFAWELVFQRQNAKITKILRKSGLTPPIGESDDMDIKEKLRKIMLRWPREKRPEGHQVRKNNVIFQRLVCLFQFVLSSPNISFHPESTISIPTRNLHLQHSRYALT